MTRPAYTSESPKPLTAAQRAAAVAAAAAPKPAAKRAKAPQIDTSGLGLGSYPINAGITVMKDPRLPGFEFHLELVTPERAQFFLDRLPKRQRRQSAKTGDRYSVDMASSQWPFIADSISFNAAGELIDGQHRSRAIIDSNSPQFFLICVGLDPEAIVVFDTGRPRRFSDWLTIEGISNPSAVASLTRRVLDWRRGNYAVPRVGRIPSAPYVDLPASPAQLMETFRSAPDDIQLATRQGLSVARLFPRKTASASVLGFAWLLFGKYDIDLREKFFHELTRGPDRNQAGYPLYTLRNRISREVPAGQQALDDWIWLNFIFQTWNRWLGQDSIQQLRTPVRPSYSNVEIPIDPHAAARPAGWSALGGPYG